MSQLVFSRCLSQNGNEAYKNKVKKDVFIGIKNVEILRKNN
jgi:hypothetical protein